MAEQKINQGQIQETHLVRNALFILGGLVFLIAIIFSLFYFVILPDEAKCLNVVCDDGNLCTIDECSIRSGACYNKPKKCGNDEMCDINTGNCRLKKTTTSGGVLDEIEQAVSDELAGSALGDIGNQISDVGNQEEDVGGQTSEVGEPVDVMDQIESAIEGALAG